jgi:hypothetical protein
MIRHLLVTLLLTTLCAACSGAPNAADPLPQEARAAAPPAAPAEPVPTLPPDAEPVPAPLPGDDPATVPLPGTDDPQAGVDYSCQVDSDCEVKNIGNCCGYYPACVNRASPTFPDQVRARCEAEGMMSICGFPEISGCRCDDGRCSDITGPGGGGDVR